MGQFQPCFVVQPATSSSGKALSRHETITTLSVITARSLQGPPALGPIPDHENKCS